jgi:mRNA-degrading endonuclease toxin of MazEF toxin-antitoxin module
MEMVAGQIILQAVNLDHIQTVPKAHLGSLIASLSSERMMEVQRAIGFALGFDTDV